MHIYNSSSDSDSVMVSLSKSELRALRTLVTYSDSEEYIHSPNYEFTNNVSNEFLRRTKGI